MELKQIIPLIDFYLSEKGESLTSANAKKNENTNQNRTLMCDLDNFQLYDVEISMVTTTTNPPVYRNEVKKLALADFEMLNTIAENNAESAVLGNGIKFFNAAMKTIRSFNLAKLAELDGFDCTLPEEIAVPVKKTATTDTLENVLNYEKVEDILGACTNLVIDKLNADTVKKALRLEAEAAVLGKQIKPEAFLQKVISSQSTLKSEEHVTNFALIIKTPKIAYNESEIAAFLDLFKQLEKRYQSVQGQLNGLKKQIKDTIRATESELEHEFEQEYRAYSQRYQERMMKNMEINNRGNVLRKELEKKLLALKISL